MIQILKYSCWTIMLAFMCWALTSCTHDQLDEIGKNPNEPLDVPVSLLLPQVELDLAVGVLGSELAWYTSVFVEHTTGVHGQMQDADRRVGINSTTVNNTWNTLYSDVNHDLNLIIAKGTSAGSEQSGDWHSVGIAKVLKAMTMSVATDMWGDVPYTQADSIEKYKTPAPDKQEDIYRALISLLDTAISDLSKDGLTDLESIDFYYKGNTEQWIKVAYGLKARLHNRLSRRDPVRSANAALEAVAMSLESATDDLKFSDFTEDATGQNSWYQFQKTGFLAVSETVFDLMNSHADPRIDLWFGAVGGEIVPAPNGLADADQAGSIYSKPATDDFASKTDQKYLGATSSLPLLTFDEIKYIEAEALLRLGKLPDAHDTLMVAVRASLERAGVATTSIDGYISNLEIDPKTDITLEDIIEQKYLSFWLYQPIEAYNDYRRTGIPELNNTVGEAPKRMPYAQDEISANPNIQPISTQQPIWWAE